MTASERIRAAREAVTWHCPHCAASTLPPAVNPSGQRFCVKCGETFEPRHAVTTAIHSRIG